MRSRHLVEKQTSPDVPRARHEARLGAAEAAAPHPPEVMDAASRRAVERGLEQALRGEFAAEAEVEAAFRRFE